MAHYLPDTILDALLSFHLHSPGPGGHRYKDRSCDLWLTEPVAKLTDDRDISSNSLGCLDIIFWGHRHTWRQFSSLQAQYKVMDLHLWVIFHGYWVIKQRDSFFIFIIWFFSRRKIAWAGVKSALINLLILDCLFLVCFWLLKNSNLFWKLEF